MIKEDYGEKFHEHLLEQYKLYVEMASRISVSRAKTNRFYISLLSGLLAVLSIGVNKDVFNNIQNIVFLAVAILGLALCLLWYINLRSYRQLNSGKFKVIHEMERNLPCPCYNREWEILGEGKEGRKYLQLTQVEPYMLLFVYSLYMWIRGI